MLIPLSRVILMAALTPTPTPQAAKLTQAVMAAPARPRPATWLKLTACSPQKSRMVC